MGLRQSKEAGTQQMPGTSAAALETGPPPVLVTVGKRKALDLVTQVIKADYSFDVSVAATNLFKRLEVCPDGSTWTVHEAFVSNPAAFVAYMGPLTGDSEPPTKRPRTSETNEAARQQAVIGHIFGLSKATEANNELRVPEGHVLLEAAAGRRALVVTKEADKFCNTFIEELDQPGNLQNHMVTGVPGSGKSCCCMLLLYRVMKRQAESADKRDIIFQYGSDTFWIKNKTGTLKVEPFVGGEGYGIFISDSREVDLPLLNSAKHAIFTSPRNDDSISHIRKRISATIWYYECPTLEELEHMRTLEGHFSRMGVTRQLMLHMVALVGPKPRDVLNDNRSDQSRWRVLKNVLAAVHGLTTQDLLHVHTLGSSWTKLSFTLFLLKAVNTHAPHRARLEFASPWIASLAAQELWLADKGAAVKALHRSRWIPSLQAYHDRLYEHYVFSTLSLGVRLRKRELKPADHEGLTQLQASLPGATAEEAPPPASAAGQQVVEAGQEEPAGEAQQQQQQQQAGVSLADELSSLVNDLDRLAAQYLYGKGEEAPAPVENDVWVADKAPPQAGSSTGQQHEDIVTVGPYTLLLGSKELSELQPGELLRHRTPHMPAADGATGHGVLIQVTTSLSHPLDCQHFNDRATELARVVGASNVKLVWVVPKSIYEQFEEQPWHDVNKRIMAAHGFAAHVQQQVWELDVHMPPG